MEKSRSKNSLLIFGSGTILRVVNVLIGFVSRTIFIYSLGAVYLGLNGLFSNILSILSLAELGIGISIAFYLYKPISENDTERIKTLMMFYRMCYRIIGFVILLIGLALVPLLPKIVSFDTSVDINLNLLFILNLFGSVTSYLFFAYKSILITANQKGYLINVINTIMLFVTAVVCAIILLVFKNYVAYLAAKILLSILQSFLISKKTDKVFPYLKEKVYTRISVVERKKIFKDVYSIFILKLSGKLFHSTDNIIISVIVGTIYVGYNSNYLMFIGMIQEFFALLTSSITGAVGNINAIESQDKQIDMFEKMDFLNFWFTSFCAVCLFNLMNPFISIWIGSEYLFSDLTVAVIVINFFFTQLLNIVFIFRSTKGLFQYAKYRQLIAAVLNIFLSFVLGKKFGVIGIFAATTICTLLIAWIPYPKALFKHGFNTSVKHFLVKTVSRTLITVIMAALVYVVSTFLADETLDGLLIKFSVAIILPNLILFIIFRKTNEFLYFKDKGLTIIRVIGIKKKPLSWMFRVISLFKTE